MQGQNKPPAEPVVLIIRVWCGGAEVAGEAEVAVEAKVVGEAETLR